MTPPLAAADRQTRWAPTWVFECAAMPHVYAGRDTSIPSVLGDPFVVGDSEVGGPDYVGGGAGPDAIHAWGRITRSPTVTRRISDPFWPILDLPEVTIQISEVLTDDYAAEPFTLSRYDAETGLRLYEFSGLIAQVVCDREGTTITGTSSDAAILEEQIPAGTITTEPFPLAAPDALGQTPTWLFGNVKSLPLPCVCDDQVTSRFDYLLCRETVAALTGMQRLGRNPDDPAQASFDIDFIELEPYPGMDGVLENGSFEDWDTGPTGAPTGWFLNGAGGTIAKNITPAQVSLGSASASVTRVGTDVLLNRNLAASAAIPMPLAWWQGREISVAVDVFATVASRGLLRVDDGVTTFDSSFHTGGGTFETLTVGTVSVPCVISAAATRVRVECRVVGGNTTVHFDNVRVYLRAKSWAEIPRPDLYDAYTAVRFFLRQEDGSGSLYPIVGDVNGLQPERNPVRAIRTLLEDGLGRTVSTFKAGEIAATLTFEDAINLDAPELFLPFRDTFDSLAAATATVRDRSGHARDGIYHKGAASFYNFSNIGPSGGDNDAYLDCRFGDGDWISVPDSPAFSGQTVGVRCEYQIPTLPNVTLRPIVEKLVGPATLSGYGLYRENNNLVFFVRGADAVLYTVTSPLVDVVDEDRWISVHGEASGGILRLYRDGVLAASGTYSSTIAEGSGEVLVAKFGTGSVNVGVDLYDNIVLYSRVLSAERIAAHVAAIPLAVEPPAGIASVGSPTFIYPLSEEPGNVVMGDGSGNGHDGAWVGGPTLTVPGPLNHERGILNSGGAARFANNAAQYGVETGMTLADAIGSIAVWYRPTAAGVNAGICEKTIGGVRDTQWGLCQRRGPGAGVIRFTVVTTAGTFLYDIPLLAEDIGRWTFIVARYRTDLGTVRVFKNGLQSGATGVITGTIISGVGDFYVGIQGTVAGVRTRPAQGDIAGVQYYPSVLDPADVAAMWVAGTWYNGGITVDLAMREPRPAVDWLAAIAQLRGIRLGFTTAGTITVSVDAAPPSSILIDARDGPGDGARNIVAIGGRTRPALQDRVRDVVVKYRRDLVTGEYLGEFRHAVSTKLDAQGRRVGRDRVFTLDAVREHPCADRFAHYAATRFAAAEQGSVDVTLHQEARRLLEGDLVQVTEAILGYTAEVLEVREVRKALATIEATLQGWDEDIYTYDPTAFTPDATSG